MTEALDKAEAVLAEWDAANARLVRIWYANHHHLADALRALITEHRRLLAELDEAHAHFQVQEARIREARRADDATEWEYAAGYQGDNGLELRWFALNGPFSIKEAAEYEITKYADDPQVRLIRRPRPGPWEPAALTPDGQEKNR